MADTLAQFTQEVRARVASLGYDVADLRRRGAGKRMRVQVRIDRPDTVPGRGITVDECAEVSRALEQWLDETGVLGPHYVLEVSSPGLERPLRWREHWVRFVGRDVNVTVTDVGRVRATIAGVEGNTVALRLAGGEKEITVPLETLRNASLAVDWDALGTSPR